MAVTFGPLGSAPPATPENVGDYRVDLDALTVAGVWDGATLQPVT